jgi:hypothetical protein
VTLRSPGGGGCGRAGWIETTKGERLNRPEQNRPPPMAASGSPSSTATVQLNVRVEAVLANKLRQRARELHTNPGALVAQAIEQFLDSPQGGEQQDDVLQRLERLEHRFAAMDAEEQQPDSQ